MIYDIILTRENNIFVARSKDWLDVVVKEQTREAALNQIKIRLADYLTKQYEVIQVNIPYSLHHHGSS